ncbi:MAG: hypothetical protein IJM04_05620 [Prevotella sp.]|nr:hypothetical protein [Prevotella sp.]
MAKDNKTKPSHVLIFVEGDTDEVFFKALLAYYAQVSTHSILPYDVCNLKGVTRYTSKLLAKLRNEYLPNSRKGGYKIKTVCCSYDTDIFERKYPQIVNWSTISKSVKRMGIEEFIQVGVRTSIEDWILDDIQGICQFLKLKEVPTSFKCKDGYGKMLELYGKARRVYKKGYETRELINTLDMSVIRKKRNCALIPLEMALGVVPEQAVNR